MKLSVAATVSLVVLLAASDGLTSASTIAPSGLLAFQSLRDGDYEIYVARPNGTGLRRLTRNSGKRPDADDVRPTWSPDGTRIAYTAGEELYVVGVDGSHRWRVPTGGRRFDYSWEPNGRRLAFSSHGDIFAINADGTGLRRLTRNLHRAEWYLLETESLKWSPDGRRIAFDWRSHVYVMRADGSNMRPLLEAPFEWAWSPTGREIGFLKAYGFESDARLGVIDVVTGKRRWLFRGTLEFTWSPDGGKMTLDCNPHPADSDVCRLDRTTGAITNLTATTSGGGCCGSWSPDSKRIAFVGFGGVEDGVFVMNAVDGTVSRLTTTYSGEPSWSPDGRLIAFNYERKGRVYVIPATGGKLVEITERSLNGTWQPHLRR